MTKGVQQRRGNTAEHAVFNGEPGEVTVNTDRWTLVVQDGTTNGGYEHVSIGATQRVTNKDIVATNLTVSGVSTFADVSQFNVTGVGTVTTLRVTDGSVSGNLGLGTQNPGARLNVVPTSTNIAGLFSGTTSDDMVRITQLGTGNALLIEDSANPDGTPFVVHSAGPVGCGTAIPGAQLHVRVDTGGPAAIAGLFSGTSSDDMVRITQLGTGNALSVEDETNPDTTPFVVTGFGSVGITTNAPTAKLHIGPGGSTAGTAPLEFTSGTLLTVADAGVFEYATPAAYFTPNGSERGVILTPQYFVLNADRTGPTAANESWPIFGVTCSLSANRYAYELNFSTTKSSANAAAVAFGIGTTTGTVSHHRYTAITGTASTTGGVAAASIMSGNIVNPPTNAALAAHLNTISAVSAAAASAHNIQIFGVIEVSSAVTGLNPRFAYTLAPTTSLITSKASMKIWPVGATGSNTSVGTWV